MGGVQTKIKQHARIFSKKQWHLWICIPGASPGGVIFYRAWHLHIVVMGLPCIDHWSADHQLSDCGELPEVYVIAAEAKCADGDHCDYPECCWFSYPGRCAFWKIDPGPQSAQAEGCISAAAAGRICGV